MLDQLFDLKPPLSKLFPEAEPWEWLKKLQSVLLQIEPTPGNTHGDPYSQTYVSAVDGPVYISPKAKIGPFSVLKGPLYIGDDVEIGSSCLIRGGCFIAKGCHIGHSVEIKHSILMEGATCGHRNYIGDSVIGCKVNFGDGSGTANLRADRDPHKTIKVTWRGERVDTGLRKFGALVGDGSSIGCRSTLNPGTILGKDCLILCNVSVKGTHPPRTMFAPPAPTITSR